MLNFNQLLAEYLQVFGDYVRSYGYELEYRGIQHYLYNLSSIVEKDDIEALAVELADLKEELAQVV